MPLGVQIKGTARAVSVCHNNCTIGHSSCPPALLVAWQVLLELGAYLEAKDGQGNTPLHLARYAPVAEVLLEAGADMKATNRDNRTPLEEATRYGSGDNYALVQLLQKWDKKALKNEEKEAGELVWGSVWDEDVGCWL